MQGTRIILATHGYFAEGILSSAKIIAGDVKNIETLCCYIDENENYEMKIHNLLKAHNYEQLSLLVITDLLGGSINTIFMKYLNIFPFQLISGLNLALLLECMMQKDLKQGKLREIIQNSSQAIQLCNDCLQYTCKEDDF